MTDYLIILYKYMVGNPTLHLVYLTILRLYEYIIFFSLFISE